MEFGTLIFTKPQRAISDTRLIEEHGFTHAWFADSQMIWGDVYACMALAAVNSSKIKLATGISVASNRIPPVTVHSIATINEIAPGRVMLGFGTGHTGRRVMGLPPVKFADFREQVRVIRDLLKDGEALYNTEGLSRKIRYLHRDRRFINLDDAIPFYVAANGPRTLGVAGEFADGIITTGVATPERLQAVFRHAEEGARKAGRDLPRRLPCVSLTQVMVIKPGEAIDSPRVMQMVGPWVITCLHAIAAGYAKPRSLPPDARKVYDAYADYIAHLPGPPQERYLELHNGHCTFVPERERRFVTAETIRATTLIGTHAQVIEQLRALERAGLDQIILNPPMDGFEEFVKDFAREIIERM
ncbi:MAG: LLM class flavin-dependent oxidoreductase [Candidatus Binataceae bacterium]|jgi:alkanesulfonate monooxygenase SsuD/methylene tetrahydromethanopterin reductase-like flavin-dependent oxidoreductase (luciferase family)